MHQQGRLNIFQRNYIGRLYHTNDVGILRQFNKLAKQVKDIRNKSVCHERAHTLELTFELAELCGRQNIREFDQQFKDPRILHLLLLCVDTDPISSHDDDIGNQSQHIIKGLLSTLDEHLFFERGSFLLRLPQHPLQFRI